MHIINIKLLSEVFVTLTVIMDPFGNIPIFLSLTKNHPVKSQRRLALQSVLVAGAVIAVFGIFGQEILSYLGISIPALQGSGGLLLLIVALQLLTGEESEPEDVSDVSIALVPLGTPLIAGPGAIATIIVFSRSASGTADYVAIAVALVGVLLVLWVSLRYSLSLVRVLKKGGITLLTRVFGLLLAAIAVQMAAQSIKGFMH